ncbi:MAG: uracil-DNA glycosylase [Sulfolobales archaeon]
MNDEWSVLINEIRNCQKCPLSRTRINAVPGEGSERAEIMIVGEAPGATEDETGRPFVGIAGSLLRKIMKDIGLREDEVYITNVVKCRPPNNRTPEKEEIIACSDYLRRQIKMIKPKIVITLGNVAGEWFFNENKMKWNGISRQHGRKYELEVSGHRFKLIPSYHPSAAVRGSVDPDIIREDLLKALEELNKQNRGSSERIKTLYDYLSRDSQTSTSRDSSKVKH